MADVIQPQKKDSMGQLGNMVQMAKSAYDMKKGMSSGSQPPPQQQQPPQQPDLSAGQAPQNNSGAIDRRIKMSQGSAAGGY